MCCIELHHCKSSRYMRYPLKLHTDMHMNDLHIGLTKGQSCARVTRQLHKTNGGRFLITTCTTITASKVASVVEWLHPPLWLHEIHRDLESGVGHPCPWFWSYISTIAVQRRSTLAKNDRILHKTARFEFDLFLVKGYSAPSMHEIKLLLVIFVV